MKRSTVRWAAFVVVIACVAAALLVWLNPGAIKTLFCNPANAVTQHLIDAGFEEGTFIVNPSITITGADAASERGSGAFSQDGAYTGEALKAFLSSTDPNAALAMGPVNAQLADRKVGWVLVYFTQSINIEGNLGVENGTVVDFGTRESGAGELIWFPVDQADCTVVDGLIIRAGCANPGTRVVPVCKEEEGCLPCPPTETCEGGKDANTGVFQTWNEDHSVNNNDGSKDPQGLQTDPKADAEAAEQDAKEDAATQEQEHQDAVDDAPVVNEEIPAGPVSLD